MKLDPAAHLQLRLQSLLFTALFLSVIGMLAWLSTRYTIQADWSREGRNTLSEASRKVLKNLEGAVDITVFALERGASRARVRELVGRYQGRKTDVRLKFINPDLAPDKAEALGVTREGEMLIEFQGRREMLRDVDEAAITNALQRLARTDERWITFLTGHGERDPQGTGKRDLGSFGDELRRKGISAQSLNFATLPDIPANTSVLVLASPQSTPLPGEIALIGEFVERGGNLLWLTEPNGKADLSVLEERLALRVLPGVVVDATTQLFGVDNPAFTLISEYFPHPLTENFRSVTVFPFAAALEINKGGAFSATPFLATSPKSWTETSPIEGRIRFDDDAQERSGPLALAFALTRDHPDADGARVQRIVVVGDGDFLSNTYLGNGGNLDMGINMIRWLSHDDRFINIPAKTAADRSLTLSPLATSLIGFGFLLLLPLALIGSGLTIWWKRRNR